jgi:outer membrane protein TolC
MKRRFVALALAAFAVPYASAEPLSRAGAVARALERNPAVRRSLADYEGLNGRVQQARADALPEVNLLGSFLRYQDPSFLNSPNIAEFPPELLAAFRPLASNLWDGSVSVRQTLWSFSLGKAIRAASYARHMGREGVERARQDVALRAIVAYNAYLVAIERAKVADEMVVQRERHLELAKNRRAAGVATDLEVLRFDVDLANARTELLRLRGAVDLARGDLNAVMVAPTDAPIEPTDSLEFMDLPADQPTVAQGARENRAELKAMAWSEKIYDEAIGIFQADSRPRLDLSATFGWSVRETRNFFEPNYKKWNLALTLKVPLFDGWRTAGRVAQARADRARIGQDKLELQTMIDLEAKQAVDRLRVARSVLQSAELNVSQARRALEMTEANYRLGAGTTLDVLDAQAALTQARMSRVEALWAHANARAGLRYVMGQNPLDDGASAPATTNQAPAPAGGAPADSATGRD